MKLWTHYLISIGVTAAIVVWPAGGFDIFGALGRAVPALIAAVATDKLIDSVGHERHGYIRQRTPVSHSIFTAPIWGIFAGVVIGFLFGIWGSLLVAFVPGVTSQLFLNQFVGAMEPAILGGLIASFCHLFSDSITMRGIFIPAVFTFRSESSDEIHSVGLKEVAASITGTARNVVDDAYRRAAHRPKAATEDTFRGNKPPGQPSEQEERAAADENGSKWTRYIKDQNAPGKKTLQLPRLWRTPTSGTRACAKCGRELIEEAKFCDNCGSPVATPAPDESAKTAPAQSRGFTLSSLSRVKRWRIAGLQYDDLAGNLLLAITGLALLFGFGNYATAPFFFLLVRLGIWRIRQHKITEVKP